MSYTKSGQWFLSLKGSFLYMLVFVFVALHYSCCSFCFLLIDDVFPESIIFVILVFIVSIHDLYILSFHCKICLVFPLIFSFVFVVYWPICIQFQVLIYIFSYTSYNIKCPHTSHWNLRANHGCNDTAQYYCLFDENSFMYTEFCRRTPDFEGPGNIFLSCNNNANTFLWSYIYCVTFCLE